MNKPDTPSAAKSMSLTVTHAAVPGRLRLRCNLLKGGHPLSQKLTEYLRSSLRNCDVNSNPVTGSLLIRFEKSYPHAEITDLVASNIAAALTASEATVTRNASPQAEIASLSKEAARPAHKKHQITPDPSPPPLTWHDKSLSEVQTLLGLQDLNGLSGSEALERLAKFGSNGLPEHKPESSAGLILQQFDNLPVKMLGVSAIVSMATGRVVDAVATLSIVAINGVLGFVTEGQAEKTISRLTSSSDDVTVVIRNENTVEIAISEILPGDRIVLKPGTKVPADARLINCDDLLIDESIITGESVPVEKVNRKLDNSLLTISQHSNMVYAETLVAAGTGEAVVVATGVATQAAQIQNLSESSLRPRAPIEQDLEKVGAQLSIFSLIACGVFFAVGTARGYTLATMLKDALALAVAAVPEGLPTVATSTLALGIKRMERTGILVRRLDVVESLGALQTICLDKTGTLTSNKMRVEVVAAGMDCFENDEINPENYESLLAIARIAALNNDCPDDSIDGDNRLSSSTEYALLEFARRVGIDVAALRERHPRTNTVERSARRRFMTTVHTSPSGEQLIYVKGSPDDILSRSKWLQVGKERRILTESDRQAIRRQNQELSSRPARVLGFAVAKNIPNGDKAIEELVWVGLAGMVDPIRPGAKEFVKSMHSAGIETVLITGDQASTAEAIASELDLSNGEPLKTVDSSNLELLDPDLLTDLAQKAHVFSRVNPNQKLLIIRALQAAGRIVAMTGDGVNDGPALKAANIGIAMGQSGSNLAKDVANVVIVDDELPTLASAVAQGRTIYRNIQRSLEFLIATNLSEIVVEILEALHGPGELENPMELLWINLATDIAPGLGLALASPDDDVLSKPPRQSDEPIIPHTDLQRIGLDSSVIAASALASHFYALSRYGAGPKTRGMTFLTLAIGQLLYALGCQRTDPRQIRIGKLLENKTLDASLLLSIAFTALPFFSPPLRKLLQVSPLGRADLLVSLGAATIPLGHVLSRRGIEIVRHKIEDEE